jgi:hypothetical protein
MQTQRFMIENERNYARKYRAMNVYQWNIIMLKQHTLEKWIIRLIYLNYLIFYDTLFI